MMKHKCGNCFRCIEDWKDAKKKGFQPQGNMMNYSQKPRAGIDVVCTNADTTGEVTAGREACRYWEHRLIWNFKIWWKWGFTYSIKRWFEAHIRVPLGGLRKPVPLGWQDGYGGKEPVCPHCGEMPYSYEQCVFCGQRFKTREETE